MSAFRSAIDALFTKRHSTTVVHVMPTELFMALETLVYLRNCTPEGTDVVDRDYIMNAALAQYLQYHLADKNGEKIAAIPPAPPDDLYTTGRRQSR
jgi:hypothetical protein